MSTCGETQEGSSDSWVAQELLKLLFYGDVFLLIHNGPEGPPTQALLNVEAGATTLGA